MHWATEMAERIIKEKGDQKLYTVASGISPSGNVHVGNFREVLTTFFVAEELRNLGKKVRFIFSWDNYDRFRKVPKNIDASFEQYIGKSYTNVPSPTGEEESYAKHFQNKFENELKKMDVQTEFIYQTDQYKSGRYNKNIIEAIEKRKEIFDILYSFKTQTPTEAQREAYYPMSVFCNKCQKDNSTITNYNINTNALTYTCSCGHTETIDVKTATNMKLDWKIDWPMRWREESVMFEPGGRDHASEAGSYTVSSVISKKIFGYDAPIFLGYDFIGIKGSNQKISSSTGNTITITDLLNIYDKHIIKWFYAKYKATQAFDICLDNDVIRYYSEFDRFVKAYFEDKPIGETAKDNIRLTNITKDYTDTTPFNYLATFMPMVNYNETLLKELMTKEGIDVNNANFESRKQKAMFWLENYGANYKINILENFNSDYYKSMDEISKKHISKVATLLEKSFDSATELQNELYSIAINEDDEPKEKKTKQKEFFKHLYNLTTGENKGPKLGLFLLALEKEKLQKLLKA